MSWNGFSPNIIWHFSTSFLQLTHPDLFTSSGYPKQPMKMPPSKDYLYAPKSFPLMSFQWGQCRLVRSSIVYISLIFSCTFHWSSRCRSPLSIEQASNWNGFYKCTGEGSCLWTTVLSWSCIMDQALFHPPAYATPVNMEFTYLEENSIFWNVNNKCRKFVCYESTSPWLRFAPFHFGYMYLPCCPPLSSF